MLCKLGSGRRVTMTEEDTVRQKYIEEMTALLKKLEIKDIEDLLKAARKKDTNISASKAVSNMLESVIGKRLKLPFMSVDCTWKYGVSTYKQLKPELSFEVQRSSGSNRVIVMEIDEGCHSATSYTNPYAIDMEFHRNFVYLRKARIFYKSQHVLVDIVRAGFEKHDVGKKSIQDGQLIENLKKYVTTLLKEDPYRNESTIRFWNYPPANAHISYWRSKNEGREMELEDKDPLCTVAFILDEVHIDNVKLKSEG